MSTCPKNELAAYNGHNLASDPYWSRPTDYFHKPSPQARINARNNQWEGRDLSSRVGVVYAAKRGRFQRVKGSIPEGCNRAWCSRNIHLHTRKHTNKSGNGLIDRYCFTTQWDIKCSNAKFHTEGIPARSQLNPSPVALYVTIHVGSKLPEP